jgi:hypothetical protein
MADLIIRCEEEAEFIAIPGTSYPYSVYDEDLNLRLCRKHLDGIAKGPFQVEGISDRAKAAVEKWRLEWKRAII